MTLNTAMGKLAELQPLQPRAVAVLRNGLARGRPSRSDLLFGPPGVGQERLALAVAQALNCETLSDDACGNCHSCRKIAEGIHPDVIAVLPYRGKPYIQIDAVRHLQSADHSFDETKHGTEIHPVLKCGRGRAGQIFYPPLEGRRTVVFVPRAEGLTRGEGQEYTANAFLKTLEEPPHHVTFLLTSHSIDEVLPTIRSRCRPIALSPWSEEALIEQLRGDLAELSEGQSEASAPPRSDDDLRLAAHVCGGSPERALELLRGGLFEDRRRFLEAMLTPPAVPLHESFPALLRAAGGAVGRATAEGSDAGNGESEATADNAGMAGGVGKGPAASSRKAAGKTAKEQDKIERFGRRAGLRTRLEWMRGIARDLAVIAATGQPERAIHRDFAGPMTELAARGGVVGALGFASAISMAITALDRNLAPPEILFALHVEYRRWFSG